MKYIELTKGYRAIVDDEDFDWLNQWQWCVQREEKHSTGCWCTHCQIRNQLKAKS